MNEYIELLRDNFNHEKIINFIFDKELKYIINRVIDERPSYLEIDCKSYRDYLIDTYKQINTYKTNKKYELTDKIIENIISTFIENNFYVQQYNYQQNIKNINELIPIFNITKIKISGWSI